MKMENDYNARVYHVEVRMWYNINKNKGGAIIEGVDIEPKEV